MGARGARGLAQLQAWRALSLSLSPTHTPHDTHNTDTNKKKNGDVQIQNIQRGLRGEVRLLHREKTSSLAFSPRILSQEERIGTSVTKRESKEYSFAFPTTSAERQTSSNKTAKVPILPPRLHFRYSE